MALHPDQVSHKWLVALIISTACALVAFICVVIRLVQRQRYRVQIWWDDWAIVVGMVFSLGEVVVNILMVLPSVGGAGYSSDTYSPSQLETFSKLAIAFDDIYTVSTSFSKASILLFYRRIFSIDKHFLFFLRAMLFLIVGIMIMQLFGMTFANPQIINVNDFVICAGVISIVTDAVIFGMIQGKIWRLQMDTRRKVLISLLLAVGIFSIITSVLRIIYVETQVITLNQTATLTNAWLWANVEINAYIICACLPVIYSLIRLQVRTQSRAASNGLNKGPKDLVTFGSTPARQLGYKYGSTKDMLNESQYRVLCEQGQGGEEHSLRSLNPVHVRTEFSVHVD